MVPLKPQNGMLAQAGPAPARTFSIDCGYPDCDESPGSASALPA
jgi:hypothetical protein